MVHEHEGDADRDHDLPRTTTTGDERQDYRHPGDSSVQLSERDDPRATDPDSTGHSEDDDLLPDVDADPDEEQEDLGDIERPGATSRIAPTARAEFVRSLVPGESSLRRFADDAFFS